MGHHQRPLGPEALWTKFSDCTHDAIREMEARRLFDMLQRLETVGSMTELPVIDIGQSPD